jgi:hypothetical protein
MSPRTTIALLCAPLLATGVAACGATTVSTSSFKGEQQKVAQTVAHLQSHATAQEPEKICSEDLAATTVAHLKAAGGCKHAVESQLKDIDNFEATVELVSLEENNLALAHVKSISDGQSRLYTLTFVREGGKWRITGIS